MHILLRLLADLVRMAISFILRFAFLVLGCGVRLLYWSVRQYGWGRVAGLATALGMSTWGYVWLRGWALDSYLFPCIVGGTAVLWSCGLWFSGTVGQVAGQGTRAFPGPFLSGSPVSSRPCFATHRAAGATPVAPPAGSLWGQLVQWETLRSAWERVRGNSGAPGVDGVTVEHYTLDWEHSLKNLQNELEEGRYRPRLPRWVEVRKSNGGVRRLAVLTVRDRIVQQTMLHVLSPLWDGRFSSCSYAYRPHRSALQAVQAVERALGQGRVWVVEGDIESFFDRVPHQRLFALLEEWLPDERVRWLLRWSVAAVSPSPDMGIAQGAAVSPLLANLFLHGFDEALSQAGHVLVRYADDFVILCATRPQAEEAVRMASRLLRALGLNLHPQKSRIVHRDEGFTFLGFHFSAAGKRPSDEAVRGLKCRVRDARHEEDRRRLIGAWQTYFGTGVDLASDSEDRSSFPSEWDDDDPWHTEALPLPHVSVGSGTGSQPASSDLALYRSLFVGRHDVFGRHWRNDAGRQGYLPVRRSVTDEELLAHLRGECVLGSYPLRPDGGTKAVVLDIDGPTIDEAGRQEAHRVALELRTALHQHGLEPLLFDSGGKGRHLWLCFRTPVGAAAVRARMHSFLEALRPFPSGVAVEVFPKQDWLPGQALGALIRLPLGRHPETRRLAQLLDSQGRPLANPWPWLQPYAPMDPSALGLPDAVPLLPVEAPSPPSELAPVIESCALLRGVIEKAARLRHLRHTERLALLYTLGHAGEAGRTYLHQVVSLCSNYSPRITERWVRRVEDGHKPIGCARLKEWLRDYLPAVSCACPAGRRLSPLHWLPPKKAVPSGDGVDELSDEVWGQVAEDLFSCSGTGEK